jgi:hypothetical protein
MSTLGLSVLISFTSAFARLDRANIWPVILLTLAVIGLLLVVFWVRIRFFQKIEKLNVDP